MNVRERVEVENKKNNGSLSLPYYLWIVSVCQGKYRQKKKKKKKERKKKKEKDAGSAQTKLNPSHVRYNIKTLPQ